MKGYPLKTKYFSFITILFSFKKKHTFCIFWYAYRIFLIFFFGSKSAKKRVLRLTLPMYVHISIYLFIYLYINFCIFCSGLKIHGCIISPRNVITDFIFLYVYLLCHSDLCTEQLIYQLFGTQMCIVPIYKLVNPFIYTPIYLSVYLSI